jgi:NAD(P)-dependent dehydrogenase (short-subunit alcohol dehydrogenase family)
VDEHLQSVIDKAGRVDISFNAVGIPNAKIWDVRLTDLDVEQFSLPITTHARSYFLTARLAARHGGLHGFRYSPRTAKLQSRESLPRLRHLHPGHRRSKSTVRAGGDAQSVRAPGGSGSVRTGTRHLW